MRLITLTLAALALIFVACFALNRIGEAAPIVPSFISGRVYSLATPGIQAANPAALAGGDFNADGERDFAVALRSGTRLIVVVLGNPDGSFGPAVRYSVGSFPESIVAHDLNNDGKLDLAVANGSGNFGVSVLLGDGLGGFGTATNFSTGSPPSSIAAADLNGDQNADLIVSNNGTNVLSVLLGNGTGQFGTPTSFATGPGAWFHRSRRSNRRPKHRRCRRQRKF